MNQSELNALIIIVIIIVAGIITAIVLAQPNNRNSNIIHQHRTIVQDDSDSSDSDSSDDEHAADDHATLVYLAERRARIDGLNEFRINQMFHSRRNNYHDMRIRRHGRPHGGTRRHHAGV